MPVRDASPVLLGMRPGSGPHALLAQVLHHDGPEGFCEAVEWVERLRGVMSPEALERVVWMVVPDSDLRSASVDRGEGP